jgi:hypothetical protein
MESRLLTFLELNCDPNFDTRVTLLTETKTQEIDGRQQLSRRLINT